MVNQYNHPLHTSRTPCFPLSYCNIWQNHNPGTPISVLSKCLHLWSRNWKKINNHADFKFMITNFKWAPKDNYFTDNIEAI